MPSKSGNRRRPNAGITVTLGGALPETDDEMEAAQPGPPTPEIDPRSFLPDDDLRPLRLGDEVRRFNDLARRQEELTGAEADDLYRYRIRRLHARVEQIDRAINAGDEQAIRRAVADFDRRLAERQRLEADRQEAGLPVAPDFALSTRSREVALDTLVAIANRRPRGVVAGSEEAPPQPTGSVRLTEAAFAPGPDDAPLYVLAPRSIPSDAMARNIAAVAGQGAQVHLVHDPADIPRQGPPALVLNWGSTQHLPDELVTLNSGDAVRVASDQVASVQRLGELAPRTVLNPQDIPVLGAERVVAKRRHGARGSGGAVLSASVSERERARYDLYQEFIPDGREYRVSVLSDGVVSAYVRHRPEGSGSDDLRPDWRYEQASVLPRSVVAAAREAARRVGLDYAGVDVVEDRSTGRVYCLEANAAPGMSEDTVRSLYAHVQRAVRGRAARAS